MSVKSLTYYDIPPDIRKEAADKVRIQLRTSLANPTFTPEQRQEVVNHLVRLGHWEAGTIVVDGVTPPAVPPAEVPLLSKLRLPTQS